MYILNITYISILITYNLYKYNVYINLGKIGLQQISYYNSEILVKWYLLL